MRNLKLILASGILFGFAAAVFSSCVQVDYPTVSFRCDPSQDSACPEGYICCSDDATAYSSNAGTAIGILPAYQGKGASNGGIPIFSGQNNALSRRGMCIEDGALPQNTALIDPGAQGCPIPCNPLWDSGTVNSVCGAASICCQTVEIEPEDCVLDANLGCWRPATGQDIGSGNLRITGEPTSWATSHHATHQDPNGRSCTTFAQGDSTAQAACFAALNVADQRGFCLTTSPSVQACPLTDPSYIDACEELNIQEGRSCS